MVVEQDAFPYSATGCYNLSQHLDGHWLFRKDAVQAPGK